MALKSFLFGFLIIAPIWVALTLLILNKKKSISKNDFHKELDESINRLLTNKEYALIVMKMQGVDNDSEYALLYSSENTYYDY